MSDFDLTVPVGAWSSLGLLAFAQDVLLMHYNKLLAFRGLHCLSSILEIQHCVTLFHLHQA
jgi:hypothetical protein